MLIFKKVRAQNILCDIFHKPILSIFENQKKKLFVFSPKSVYKKIRDNKSTLGQLHMEPRIFHTHYSPEVHQGKFEIKTLSELHKKMLELSVDIIYWVSKSFYAN